MVNVNTAIFSLAVLVPAVLAKNCEPGYSYCGDTLLAKGDYGKQVKDAIAAANLPQDGNHITDSLFICDGGGNGDITFRLYCDLGCLNQGTGNDDECRT